MSKRIKILFTIPNFDTAGSGKVVHDLVKGLDRSKFDPEICCFHNRGSFFTEIKKLNVPIHIFNFSVPYKPYYSLLFRVYKISRFFKNHSFDIIHSWHWSSDFTEPLAAKLANIPFVYTKKAMGWGNKAWIWRSKLSTKIIAINSDMMTQFFNKMTYKTEQMPLGVDTSYFSPNYNQSDQVMNIDFDSSDFVIVSVANLVPVKGIEILLKAVIELNDASIKVLVIGDDNNEYGNQLKTNYQSDQFLFLGKQTDVRPYLSMADVFVIPTLDEGRKEGMPVAPIEAMSSQRIVIGSNISGIKDILKPFNQYLFEPSNVSELAEKIKEIQMMLSEDKIRIEEEMRSYVKSKLSLKRCVENHESFYVKLINNK